MYISNRHWDLILGSHSFVHEPWDLIIVVTHTHTQWDTWHAVVHDAAICSCIIFTAPVNNTHTQIHQGGFSFIFIIRIYIMPEAVIFTVELVDDGDDDSEHVIHEYWFIGPDRFCIFGQKKNSRSHCYYYH